MKRFLPLFLLAVSGASWAQEQPRPSLFHTPPRQATAREPLTVEGLLVDGKRVDKLFLRFRTLGEAFRTVEMEVQYGEIYRGIIPGRWVVPPALEYYVQGVTFDGQPVALYQSEKRPTRVRVVAEPPKTQMPAPPPLSPGSSPSPTGQEKAPSKPARPPAAPDARKER